MRNAVLCVLVAFISFNNPCESFKALGLFPVPMKSHFHFYENLLKQLTYRGHELHIVNHFPQVHKTPGYFDISIKGSVPILDNVSIEETANKRIWDVVTDLYKDLGRNLCEDVINHPAINQLRNTSIKFDIILMEVHGTDCLLPFADIFEVPVVGISSGGYLPWALERMGNPDNPSYIANYFVPFSGQMNLLEKMELAFATVFTKIGYYVFSTISSEMRVRDVFGNNIKPLDVLAYNTSLLLVNAHFSLHEAKPTVPGIIEVGGLHISNIKPLPSNLSNSIHAKHGFIYMSFGSVLNISTMAEDKLKALIKSLSKLPQTILIKSEDKTIFKEVPDNFIIKDWFPQIDVLCHPNTKLFITHGGLLSVQEAAHCGVPILAIPMFADHSLLVSNYASKGAGIKISYDDITEKNIDETLNKLLTNNTYKASAEKLSTMYKDRPIKPMDNAVYWIEYIFKYGGAPQLRSRAADLIWFEYYLMDVAFVLGAFAIMFILFMIYVLDALQNYFDTPYHPPTENDKKQKEN